MKRSGHDLRLLGAVTLGWGILASALALRSTPAALAGLACACACVGSVTWLAVCAAATRRGRAGSVSDAVPSRQRHASAFRFATLTVAVSIILLSAAAGTTGAQRRGPIESLAAESASASLRATVTGEPRRVQDARDGTARYVVPVTIEEVTARGTRTSVATPAIIVGDERWSTPTWRARVSVRGRLAPATRLGAARAVVRAAGPPQVESGPPEVVAGLEPLRAGLRRSAESLPPDPSGLVPALVVGDTAGLPRDLVEIMNATGMSHLNAVSGSNVTIVLLAVMWLLAWTGLGQRARLLIALIALVAYVLLCRPEPSVVRAAAMGVVGLVGVGLGRARAGCACLGAAMLGLLIWDPWLAVSAGFALSSLATLGLILFCAPWSEALVRRLPERQRERWAPWATMLCVPLAAQVLCLPILVALSGRVSWVSVPANMAADPLVAPATVAGMMTALVSVVSPTVGAWLVWIAGLPAWGISGIARIAATIPGGSFPWPTGGVGVVSLVGLLLLLTFGWRFIRWCGRAGLLALLVAGGLLLSVLAPLPGTGAAPGGWVYAQCAVGQGDAALVRTGPQAAVAVDLGPSEGDVMGCLRRHGVERLDAVVLTHFHADHVGGLNAVLDAMPATPVFTTWVLEGSGDDAGGGEKGAKESVDAALSEHAVSAQPLTPGAKLRLADVVLEVLWPRRIIHEGSVQNNASLVLDVRAPRLHALLLGDCEREAQAAVTADVAVRAAAVPFDVVKVAHHGSSNQSERLYAAARARWGLIGVGADNDYGHPRETALAMLSRVGTDVGRTDLSGDLDMVTLGQGLSLEPQR